MSASLAQGTLRVVLLDESKLRKEESLSQVSHPSERWLTGSFQQAHKCGEESSRFPNERVV